MDHRDCDCVAVAILTHGDEGGLVYGTDGSVPLKHLTSYFKSEDSHSLVGKPKLFFIQVYAAYKIHGLSVTHIQFDVLKGIS